MQDDWAKLLPMAEFADNNALFSVTSSTPFFLNKDFHPRMSFEPDTTEYESFRERLQAAKAEDISEHMDKTLAFARESLAKTREQMVQQANKHRKEVDYETGSKVFLNGRNIVIARPSKKLDDKMLGPFTNLDPVGSSYKLKLPETMRVHDVFHPGLLRPAADDPLPGQKNEPPGPIVVNDEDEWEIDDILDSRRYRRRLQYRVK